MASDVAKFVQGMLQKVEKAKTNIEQTQRNLAQDSKLQKTVVGLAGDAAALKQELDAIQPDQPLEAAKKKKLTGDVNVLSRRAARITEGIQFAVDPQSPKVGSWIWFIVELLLIVGVAVLYVNLHQERPLRAFLRSVDPAARVELAMQAADLKTAALAAQPNLEALTKAVDGIEGTFAKAGFAPQDKAAFDEAVKRIRAELERKEKMNGEVLGVHVDRIVEDVLKAEESFFWDRGVGRYVEVLFALFFGVMVFALQNTWEYMRHPGRAWWVAWHIVKVVMAVVLGFVTIVILSQVNFATPTSLEDQQALGLGFARIELVIAVSILAGYFGHRMVGFLDKYADKLFGSQNP